jgi:hypothetical protein
VNQRALVLYHRDDTELMKWNSAVGSGCKIDQSMLLTLVDDTVINKFNYSYSGIR